LLNCLRTHQSTHETQGLQTQLHNSGEMKMTHGTTHKLQSTAIALVLGLGLVAGVAMAANGELVEGTGRFAGISGTMEFSGRGMDVADGNLAGTFASGRAA
jgi:hypothetical protein